MFVTHCHAFPPKFGSGHTKSQVYQGAVFRFIKLTGSPKNIHCNNALIQGARVGLLASLCRAAPKISVLGPFSEPFEIGNGSENQSQASLMHSEIAPIRALMRPRHNSFSRFPLFGTQVNGTQTYVLWENSEFVWRYLRPDSRPHLPHLKSKHVGMAELIRSGKSGSDWTANELAANNITAIYQDAATFFETPDLPHTTINPNVLNTLEYRDAPDDDTYRLLGNLDIATTQVPAEESAVDDFAVLLLREDKRLLAPEDPEARLIAEAIAASSTNNRTRLRTSGIPPLPLKDIAGITLTGTSPVFYKIGVSMELVSAVGGGGYPATPTIVYALIPVLNAVGVKV
ncbi:hypothetical protein FA13DRAFT_1707452 [Coprinellus micaceus]|uniref:Uncharacterized protein n=1 Tax=Coprinellus micaceus TaxID=71717 RepID=A0A4Y7TK66_COPMI|nr:hypothetical protein FA13DRAFT_1707452 [Coprinellus micaceus]